VYRASVVRGACEWPADATLDAAYATRVDIFCPSSYYAAIRRILLPHTPSIRYAIRFSSLLPLNDDADAPWLRPLIDVFFAAITLFRDDIFAFHVASSALRRCCRFYGMSSPSRPLRREMPTSYRLHTCCLRHISLRGRYYVTLVRRLWVSRVCITPPILPFRLRRRDDAAAGAATHAATDIILLHKGRTLAWLLLDTKLVYARLRRAEQRRWHMPAYILITPHSYIDIYYATIRRYYATITYTITPLLRGHAMSDDIIITLILRYAIFFACCWYFRRGRCYMITITIAIIAFSHTLTAPFSLLIQEILSLRRF